MKRLAMINSDGKSQPVVPDPEGIRTDLVELRARVLARSPYDRILTDLLTIDAAESALAADTSAIYIDTFADYGLDAIRSITNRPVVGAGESAIAGAAAIGPFSIVTVWPASMGFLYDERLGNSRGGELCRGVHHFSAEGELDLVSSSQGIQARMRRREGDLIGRLARACILAKEADGSDVVLLGCTCMSPVADRIQQLCDFPVLNPSLVGQTAALTALMGEQATGEATTTHKGEVPAVVSAWLAVRPEVITDDCDFCIATSETTERH